MTQERQVSGLPPRRAALWLLAGVLEARRPLSDLTEVRDSPLARLDAPGRARAQRLAAEVLRHLERADALLSPFLRRAPPLAVQNVLRLAVVERFVEGGPVHALVNDGVEAVRRSGPRGAHMAGMANAVLRRALSTAPEDWAALPPPELPGWLRAPLVAEWSAEAVALMEAAHMRGAPLDLTPRDAKRAGEWAERLGADLLPTGSLRLDRRAQVSALEGFAQGAWWVQDAAAALPARLLAAQPGERVLDLCAAPGGKTLQLAAAGARVTALDISGPRMERLRANLARTGLSAECVVADALHWESAQSFDAILLDAPCTATGTIRRHPDLPRVRDGSELRALVELQSALIDRALGWLRPGGRLVFATCSLLPDEGEAQLKAALARHPGLSLVDGADALSGVEPGWRGAEGGWRTRPDFWPERGGMDGFFMAALRHDGTSVAGAGR